MRLLDNRRLLAEGRQGEVESALRFHIFKITRIFMIMKKFMTFMLLLAAITVGGYVGSIYYMGNVSDKIAAKITESKYIKASNYNATFLSSKLEFDVDIDKLVNNLEKIPKDVLSNIKKDIRGGKVVISFNHNILTSEWISGNFEFNSNKAIKNGAKFSGRINKDSLFSKEPIVTINATLGEISDKILNKTINSTNGAVRIEANINSVKSIDFNLPLKIDNVNGAINMGFNSKNGELFVSSAGFSIKELREEEVSINDLDFNMRFADKLDYKSFENFSLLDLDNEEKLVKTWSKLLENNKIDMEAKVKKITIYNDDFSEIILENVNINYESLSKDNKLLDKISLNVGKFRANDGRENIELDNLAINADGNVSDFYNYTRLSVKNQGLAMLLIDNESSGDISVDKIYISSFDSDGVEDGIKINKIQANVSFISQKNINGGIKINIASIEPLESTLEYVKNIFGQDIPSIKNVNVNLDLKNLNKKQLKNYIIALKNEPELLQDVFLFENLNFILDVNKIGISLDNNDINLSAKITKNRTFNGEGKIELNRLPEFLGQFPHNLKNRDGKYVGDFRFNENEIFLNDERIF
ncbi:MAG: hypothetical protein SOW25_06905 [Helicobacter sp.]|nr:hypothetical protein [Helicobacteraceae bacterium]MDY3114037.1 hypothetical protein [Helicobacter sp.]